ncbi:MAG: RpiB/LacA/LacB family sugar-phosphate isomerase [Candidatus Paceibacterota bacterium]|jgi:ribose 5-phosphate isomerase B
MKVYFGSDHAGFELKQDLMVFAKSLGHEVIDFGDTKPEPDDDYPDYIAPVAKAVSKDPTAKGIILGGSGEGEAIMANRFPGVRAVLYYGGNMEIVMLSRLHNDANILSLGARFVPSPEARHAVKIWLETDFSGDARHIRRIGKIEQITKLLSKILY